MPETFSTAKTVTQKAICISCKEFMDIKPKAISASRYITWGCMSKVNGINERKRENTKSTGFNVDYKMHHIFKCTFETSITTE
jgi:hypothetical protein